MLACLPWVLGNHQAFESECVSDAHRPFGQNCQECHDRRLVPLARMITFNNAIHSTSDKACQKCHRESNTDHLSAAISGTHRIATLEQQLKPAFENIGCAGCHTEHRGNSELSQVANASCTNCHADVHDSIAPRKFELAFHAFASHPEFAIWRISTSNQTPPEVGSEHKAAEVHTSHSASNHTAHAPLVGQHNGQAIDQTPIKFNHHLHLDPGLRSAENKSIGLNCSDCHQSSASGDYFQPIRFEEHCHRCHRLAVPESGDLPHEKPEIIRGILIERLAKHSTKPTPRPQDELGGPTKRPIDEATSAPELVSLVKDRLADLEKKLFGPVSQPSEFKPPASLLETTCTKCHFTEKSPDTEVAWKVVPPQIPSQWMIHSHFRHDRHASVDCTICHTRGGHAFETVDQTKFYPILSKELKETSSSIYASFSATDILMPRMQVCVSCHGHQTATQASVTDKCVDCHSYHHVPASKPVPPRIRELLGTAAFSGNKVNSSHPPAEPAR